MIGEKDKEFLEAAKEFFYAHPFKDKLIGSLFISFQIDGFVFAIASLSGKKKLLRAELREIDKKYRNRIKYIKQKLSL